MQKGLFLKVNYMHHLRELELIPTHVAEALKSEDKIKEIAEVFKDSPNFLYLGRGYNFPVALEGALKLKGDLLHPCRRISSRRNETRSHRINR